MLLESIPMWFVTKVGETAFGKLIIGALEKRFPKIFKSKTKEIVAIYERRIEKKNQEIKRLERTRVKQKQRHHKEERRMVGSLKRRSIATQKLIDQYHRPLNAILISYASQHERASNGTKKSHFIKEELARYNVKYLGGSDSLIPPASVPHNLRTQRDLKKWFEKEILKDRYCKIKFLVLFDLKKNAFWGVYLPYIQKKPMHHTIGEVLSIEDVFTSAQIDRLAISEIITSGDIAWLASSVIAEKELDVILKNQKSIEKAIGNPSLRVLSDDSVRDNLVKELSKYIKNAKGVAKAIVDEAQFWQGKMK